MRCDVLLLPCTHTQTESTKHRTKMKRNSNDGQMPTVGSVAWCVKSFWNLIGILFGGWRDQTFRFSKSKHMHASGDMHR